VRFDTRLNIASTNAPRVPVFLGATSGSAYRNNSRKRSDHLIMGLLR
jgi:hypothetical protein